ncbi:hypothetical protein PTSG_01002 [Salpingoeca rosetta]|uniref:SH2 domain-containing protein n=1 Tax=Salpingoeca rosetta (strain ATCC 50818 / BSB-021) TaxID=946362 RepID=F2TY40_SALR5|nr:uncharacterized protein PTSG_01002 [Salpingoeca rosetta]EGD76299.1 hypothetical protein PTSG_01002 [Salpingoeca rosetta]|eukprot:XP_004998474.1 hypothetical protein PTSG_01002 [Salpingoeca rosetta]
MYLLDAKRKAERKQKEREAKEKRERKKQELAQAKAERKRALEAAAAQKERAQMERAMAASKAEEELRRKEEAQMQEALRRSVEEEQRAQALARRQAQARQKQQAAAMERQRQRQLEQQQQQHRQQQMQAQAGRRPTAPRAAPQQQQQQQSASEDPEQMLRQWRDVKVMCKYVGTFEVGTGAVDRESVKAGIAVMKEYIAQGRPACLLVCLEGIKVIDNSAFAVVMAHALQNVTMCTVVRDHALFGFVARDATRRQQQYCHVFHMPSPRHAQGTHTTVSKAFKLAFYKHRTRQGLETSSDERAERRQWAKHNPLQGAPHHKDVRSLSTSTASEHSPRRTPSSEAGLRGMPASPSAPQHHHHQQQQQQQENDLLEDVQEEEPPAVVVTMEERYDALGSQHPSQDPDLQPRPPQRQQRQQRQQQGMRYDGIVEEEVFPGPQRATQPSAPSMAALDREMQELELLAESQQEQDDGGLALLESAPWYQAGLPREIAMELLSMSDDGAFLVRQSQSHAGHFALTMKALGRIHNFIIKRTAGGFMLGSEHDGERIFHDLGELILFHSEHRGLLPCTLNLDAMNALSNDPSPEGDGDEADRTSFIDPDYESLRDINF